MKFITTKKPFFLIKQFAPILIMGTLVLTLPRAIKPKLLVSAENEQLNFNSDIINVFSLGQQRMISSYLWIVTLLNSDIEHYKGDDDSSWMSLRFKTIEKLEPRFYENYNFGGRYLSIIKDDVIGGERLLKNGVMQFPEDFRLRQYLAFVYNFELGKYANAISQYNILLSHHELNIKFPMLPRILKKLKQKNSFLNNDFRDEFLFHTTEEEQKNSLFRQQYLKKLKQKSHQ